MSSILSLSSRNRNRIASFPIILRSITFASSKFSPVAPFNVIEMAGKAKLPMGIENFERIRKDGFYYVDKTGLIKDFLENPAYVPLLNNFFHFG